MTRIRTSTAFAILTAGLLITSLALAQSSDSGVTSPQSSYDTDMGSQSGATNSSDFSSSSAGPQYQSLPTEWDSSSNTGTHGSIAGSGTDGGSTSTGAN